MKKISKILIAAILLIALENSALSFAQQATPSPVQTEKQILEACRLALTDLKAAKEKEAALLEKIVELERQLGLREQQVGLYQKTIEVYERAMESYLAAIKAREKAEEIAGLLFKNHEAQMKVMEDKLARANWKVRLWQALAAVAAAAFLIKGK